MDALRPFVIPISGLHLGQHEYRFEVGKEFFDSFEDPVVTDGEFVVDLLLDKRSRLLVLDFEVEGAEFTQCDRCLNPIHLPVSGEYRLYVKFGEGVEDEPDVVFIEEGAIELDVSQFVYEYISLSAPMVKVYDCDNDPEPPCNFEVLAKLEAAEETDDEEEDNGDLGPWSELKKWNEQNKEKNQ